MKKILNRNFLTLICGVAVAASLGSCVKSRDGATSFDNLKPIVMIREGGLATFGSQALTFPGTDEADTAYFRVNYAAKNVAPTDITITLGVDDNALAKYNSSLAPTDSPYYKFPDSIYAFNSTSVTVKAGQSFTDLIPVVVYPSKIDPTKNYMLPISITDASGNEISGNFGTIYYHLIGNPIAGAYYWNWHRWNGPDSTSVPRNGLSFDGNSTIFAPDNPTQIEVSTGYFTQPRYVITFSNVGGVLSNFAVKFNADDIKYMNDNGVTVGSGPNLLVADPINHHYKIQWVASTGSGPRYLTDDYYR